MPVCALFIVCIRGDLAVAPQVVTNEEATNESAPITEPPEPENGVGLVWIVVVVADVVAFVLAIGGAIILLVLCMCRRQHKATGIPTTYHLPLLGSQPTDVPLIAAGANPQG